MTANDNGRCKRNGRPFSFYFATHRKTLHHRHCQTKHSYRKLWALTRWGTINNLLLLLNATLKRQTDKINAYEFNKTAVLLALYKKELRVLLSQPASIVCFENNSNHKWMILTKCCFRISITFTALYQYE